MIWVEIQLVHRLRCKHGTRNKIGFKKSEISSCVDTGHVQSKCGRRYEARERASKQATG